MIINYYKKTEKKVHHMYFSRYEILTEIYLVKMIREILSEEDLSLEDWLS